MDTLFLATVMGWYLVVMSILLFFRHERIKLVMADVISHRDLFFVIAIITFILGLLMVVSHNVWVMGWPVFITLLSWLVLISGVIRLFFPEMAMKTGRSFLKRSSHLQIAAVLFFILGLFLLLHVYHTHLI